MFTSTIRTPNLPRNDLAPEVDATGRYTYQELSRAELLQQTATGLENEKRLKSVSPDVSRILAYKTTGGEWVVELRDPYQSNQLDPLDSLNIPRLTALEQRGELGDSLHLRLSDLRPTRSFRGLRADLAEKGIVLSAQTDENRHGFHPELKAEGDALKGFYRTSRDVRGLLARKMGHEIHTQVPEDDNLDPRRGNAFRSRMTHVMTVSELKDGVWQPNDIIPSGRIAVNFANATAIQYAQAGFEGIAGCYDGQGNVVILSLEKNAARLQRTCRALGLPVPTLEHITEAIIEAVRQNKDYVPREGGKLYIRPYIAGIEGGSGANSATRAIFAVQVWPYGDYMGTRDAAIYLEGRLDVPRPDSGFNKMSANYAPSFGTKADSRKRGPQDVPDVLYRDIVSFDRSGNIEELSTANPFFIERLQNGTLRLVTPPTSLAEAPGRAQPHILPSITRDNVILLAKKLGFEVQIEDLNVATLQSSNRNFVGMFATGTAVGLQTITGIDIKTSADDRNPVQLRFQDPAARALATSLFDHLVQIRQGKFEGTLSGLEQQIQATRIPIDT